MHATCFVVLIFSMLAKRRLVVAFAVQVHPKLATYSEGRGDTFIVETVFQIAF